MTRLIANLAGRLMNRSVRLDPAVPVSYVAARAAATLTGTLRGLILTRRRLVLGKGARVRAAHLLTLGGGLVRLEENCLLDCLGHEGVRLGRNFKLGACSRMIVSGSLSNIGHGIMIGDNVGIGEFAYIGGAGGVRIGARTIVGQYFSVHPENHVFDDPEVDIAAQGVTRSGISIGSGCWIGAKVTVIDGVTLGNHCVVAAGSVVTRSFPDRCLIGGIPARLIRRIDSGEGVRDA